MSAVANIADERSLIEAAQNDPSRFAELYECNFDRVYAFIARRVGNREEAEDLTAEVFHRALRNLARFEWRGAPFAAWLLRIAASTIATRWMRLAQSCEVPAEDIAAVEPGEDPALERQIILYQLVHRLPPDQKLVVVRRFVDQKSTREIAIEIGRSEGAVYAPRNGGGGGGAADRLPASGGAAPRFAREQLAPPSAVVLNQHPDLIVRPALIGTPDLTVRENKPVGDPLSALVAPSGGRGIHGGIGDGDRNGVGPGYGPGRGPGENGGEGGGAFTVGNGVTAPKLIYGPDPPYSDEARKLKFQGTVGVWAVIGIDGRPHDIRISNSVGLGLDESTLETVRTWRFEPGRKDGRLVPVQIYIEVNFRLL